jgi:hypothetical protein
MIVMSRVSSYNFDLQQEQILGRFLDKAYQAIYSQGSIGRVTNIDQQNQGIDLIYFKENNGLITNHNIDEKAQLTYLNKSLPTFAFELSYLLHGKTRKGWLFDANKLTEYYFLVTSIFLKNKIEKLVNESDIENCLITKVNRNNLILMLDNCLVNNPDSEKLLKEFEGEKLTEATLEKISEKLRLHINRENITVKIKLNPNIKIVYSGWLAEQPINIVIYLDYLKEHVKNTAQNRFFTNSNGEVSCVRLKQ